MSKEKNYQKVVASFVPKATEESITAGKAWLEEMAERAPLGGVGNFAGVSAKGDLTKYIAQQCHAAIGSMPDGYRQLVATCINTGARRRLQETFVNWLVNESIWAPFILNSDDLDFCCEKGLLVDGATPRKFLQQIMILSRHPKEVADKAFEVFNKLYKDPNVENHLAWNVSFCSSISDGRADASFLASHTSHRASPFWTVEDWRNFKEGNLVKEIGPSYIEEASIYGGSALFLSFIPKTDYPVQVVAHDKKFAQIVQTHRNGGKVEAYRPPNPFSPAARANSMESKSMTIAEAIKLWIPYIMKEVFNNG